MNEDMATKEGNSNHNEEKQTRSCYPSPELAEARIKLALNRHKIVTDRVRQLGEKEKERVRL